MSITKSIYGIIIIAAASVAIISAILGAAGYFLDLSYNIDDVSEKVSKLEKRLVSVEDAPNSRKSDKTEIKRRLTQAELSVNDINKELAKLRMDVGRVDNNASGLGEGLAERVDSLEKKLIEIENNPSAPSSVDTEPLLKRINTLEKHIKKLEKRADKSRNPVPIAQRPIKIDAEFTGNFPTQTVDSMEISLMGCERKGLNVVCSFIIKNTYSRIRDIDLYTSKTRVYLPSSEEQYADQVSINNETRSDSVDKDFPQDIPSRASIRFPNIDKDVPGFLLMQINLEGYIVDFRDVTIVDAL